MGNNFSDVDFHEMSISKADIQSFN